MTQPPDTPPQDEILDDEIADDVPAVPVQRPDRAWLLGYRLLGLRLPEQHRSWVATDVRSPSFTYLRTMRTVLWGLALAGLYCVGQRLGLGHWPAKATVIRAAFVVLAMALLSSREVLVRRTLRWQRVDADGRPVEEPKRLARLSGVEGAMLAVLGLVVWTGAATAFGYGLRPTGPIAAPCRAPDDVTKNTIAAGLTVKDGTIQTIRAVPYSAGTMVAGLIATPGAEKPKFGAWVVVGAKTYRFKIGEEQTSSFELAPKSALSTQASSDALKRAVECLGQAAAR